LYMWDYALQLRQRGSGNKMEVLVSQKVLMKGRMILVC